MNFRAALFGVLALGASVSAADNGIEFSGVMTAGGKTRIALTDTAKKTTTWVATGEEFNGYTVARYDEKQDAVFLKKNGRETRIPLVIAKTAEARPAPTAVASAQSTNDAATIAIRANLRQLAAAARQYQTERGATSVSYADLVGPGKLVRELRPVAGENYSTLSFGPNVTAVSVTTSAGSTVTLDLTPMAAASTSNVAATAPHAPTVTVPATAPTIASATTGAPPPVSPPTPTTTAASLPPTGPDSRPAHYTAQAGDTWEKVSTATGVPVLQLKQLNPSAPSGAALPAGQAIRVR